MVLGVTLKEKEDGAVKVSVRANPPGGRLGAVRALWGRGHQGAAGCSLGKVSLEEAQQKMEEACGSYLAELGPFVRDLRRAARGAGPALA